jgi:peptide/nickel transport system substrate-binding protein
LGTGHPKAARIGGLPGGAPLTLHTDRHEDAGTDYSRHESRAMRERSMSELEFLRQQHILGRISRREFMGRAVTLGVSASALTTLITQIEAVAAESPKKGGTMRLGLGGGSTTDSLEPGSYTDSVMIGIGHGLFNGLVEWARDGKPIPELATSWEAKSGATEYILNLRKGVSFSNGKEFDADDAVYSINLHRGETKSGAAGPMKVIKDVKKLDKYQIQVSLTEADADFAYVLTDYHILMVPNEHKDWSKPVGTGAFTLDKFDPGVRALLKKNTNYWKEGRGHLDGVEVTVINDGSARLNALLSGQVDAINRVDPKAVALIQKNASFEIVRAPGGWHPVMAMTVDAAPYDNVDLRKAMKYALDREQIIKTSFSGFATLGNDHPIPRTDPYFNSQLPQLKYDPEKVKFYLKKSGLSDPKVVLQASDAAFNGAVDMATLFQASAAKAGLKLEVKKEPADGFWDNVWLKGAFVSSYWGGRSAATQMLAVAYKANAPWNESHWKNEKFEKLLADARGETNEEKRKGYIWAMQEMLSTEGGALIPSFRDWIQGTNKKVAGITPHGGFDMDNGYVCEQAWLKA